MTTTRPEIAERLRAVRESLGFTQAEVAKALGVHRPTISEIEAGRRAVTSEELYRLAKLYAVSVGQLLGDPAPGESEVLRVLFRKDGLETPAERVAVRRFIERCRATRELEEQLGVGKPADARPAYVAPAPQTKWDAIRQGERIAKDERRRLDQGGQPVRNPLALLERQGVVIGPIGGMGPEVALDGVFFESDEVGACVGVNPQRDEVTGFRTSFTAAHEYAHWLLRDVRVEEFTFEARTEDLREVRANAFAAAFLMPEDGLRAYFEMAGLLSGDQLPQLSPGDIVRAMDYFGVSRPALLYRLQNCRLLSEEKATELRDATFPVLATFQKLGLRLPTPKQVEGRLPSLATEAWRRGLISTGRAADILGMDVGDFRDLMQLLGETQEAEAPLVGAAAKQ